MIGTLVLTVAVYFLQSSTGEFMASVLNVQKAPPFDGATEPTLKVPDWSRLASGEYKLLSADIAAEKWMPLPNYDPGLFGSIQLASLSPRLEADKGSYNTLMTYSTPYMGTYKMGSREGDGSHLAVDIRMPVGTAVYAVGNGVVEKISENAPGFGMLVLIRMDNVPLADSNETTTLWAGYAHLSKILVAKGDIVLRGQKIAESGNSGTSSGAHLHFQIDNSNAPWHPWWPYSSKDAAAVGIGFSDGIDAGLGKEAAYKNTINPMLWVQRFFTASPTNTNLIATSGTSDSSSTTTTSTTTTPTTPATVTPITTPSPSPITNTTEATHATAPTYTYALSGDTFGFVGNNVTLTLKVKNTDGSIATNPTLSTPLTVQTTGSASASPSSITASTLASGSTTIVVTDTRAEKTTVTIGEATYTIAFVDAVATISSFNIVTPTAFLLGKDNEITIQAADSSGNPTPNAAIGGTVKLTTSTGLGTFTPETLTSSNFDTSGRATVKLNYPAANDFTITAQEGALIGTSRTINPQLFTDLDSNYTYATAITYLKNANVIGGYPDGSFQPGKTVSRVEALKMILAGLKIELNPASDLAFPDAAKDAWYAPFVGRAVKLEIAKGYPDGSFGPGKVVNRAEFLKIILGAAGITTTAPDNDPYADAPKDAWFAGAAAYAKEKNLVPGGSSSLNPGDGLTRGEVAEIIYRLLAVKKSGGTHYSTDLQP